MNPIPAALTSTGQPIFYDDPSQTEIRSEDLFVGARNICRYGGQWRCSLLEHSVLVAALCDEFASTWDNESRNRLAALGALHDLHEAFVGDRNPQDKTSAFKAREARWSSAVHGAFGIAPANSLERKSVKIVDRAALLGEMKVLGHPSADWHPAKWDAYGGMPFEFSEAVDWFREIQAADPHTLWYRGILDTVLKAGGRVP